MNPFARLAEQGQSIWLDYIRRSLITSGELQRLVTEDGLKGVTSNPAIFGKAIAGSNDYGDVLKKLAGEKRLDAKGLYERIAVQDVQMAADVFAPVFEATERSDGYVSLEVAPGLAHDTGGTVEEARRLWQALDRPNAMIKVPATPDGFAAIEQLIADGINVNVTLLFAREMYEQAAEAYIRGLERWVEAGGDPSRVASVASFFVSRIDAAVDGLLEERLEDARSAGERGALRALMGKVAIANAKLAYQRYRELFSGERWEALRGAGARTQRLLWASTSTKNPEYRDVMYVEELIGPDTVNTIPPATYDAFRDHGKVTASLRAGVAEAGALLDGLKRHGISLSRVTGRLLEDGVRLFSEAFAELLQVVEGECRAPARGVIQRLEYALPDELGQQVETTLAEWAEQGQIRRLWARDATLWTGEDEAEWLGWLGITEDQLTTHLERFRRIAHVVRTEGFSDILLLGMGGSSLCPEVLRLTFARIEGFPELHVLDSTDPAQVKAFEERVDLERCLFIVASKSGSTLEPNILMRYFLERVRERLGGGEAGRRFVAITDPGSQLEAIAERDGFRRVFHGVPTIGGRFSALSDFGMVPAAAMGLDVARLLDRAEEMVHACAACVPVRENPGALLGIILGVLGKHGRDKVTLVATSGISALGAWLEQLLAESTGKQGHALIPVDREQLAEPDVYGDDRLFVFLRLASEPDEVHDTAMARLEKAGQPVVRIDIPTPYDVGQEFFRWEFATAVAGSILGINPFNQPDVEASKVATRALTERYEESGSLPAEKPLALDGAIALYADPRNETELGVHDDGAVAAYLGAHLGRIRPRDYLALLAYLPMNDANDRQLQAMRNRVRDVRRVATCVGYGPRFLHSTGQAYKGGPNTGVFLQITCDDERDLEVPGQKYSFGIVKAAQARGDFDVLAERGRRVLRVHLGPDVLSGLKRLRALIDESLS